MLRPLLVAGALLLSAQWSVVGCHRRGHHSAAHAPAADSLIGVVSITGTSFEQHLVLRSGHGARLEATMLATPPADSTAISRLGGVEIVVRGRRDGNVFRVANFAVLRVGGSPVVDGVVIRDGARLALEGGAGRISLGNPPAALRAMVGARVWVGGPLDTGPNTYGVIVPAPPPGR